MGASALPLGLLLGASRCSWPHLGSLGCLCARFWGVLGASWLGFGELWGSFRYHFRRRCAHCCRDPSMAFTLAFRYLLAARRYVRSTWNNLRKSITFANKIAENMQRTQRHRRFLWSYKFLGVPKSFFMTNQFALSYSSSGTM